MDSRISVRPAAFPNPRCPETAGEPNLAFAFLTLSAICSGLGLVVLGLEQGGTSRYLVWSRSGPNSIRRDAPQSAALLALFLVSRGPDFVCIYRHLSPAAPSFVQQILTLEQEA